MSATANRTEAEGLSANITPWLTVRGAADYTSLSADTIYRACESGELQHVKVGGRRTIRLRPEWIDAWLEVHTCGVARG